MLSVVAKRYARALMEVVAAPESQTDLNSALQQLRAVEEIIGSSTDLHGALLSPAVAPSRKRAVMAKLMAPLRPAKAVQNFLFVVIDHRRVDELSSIVDAFDLLIDERLGYIRADVSSAQPLEESQKSRLEEEISRVAGKKAKIRFSTNPILVAGVVARIGSTVYDGSVRGQLDKLRAMLAKA